MSEAINTVRIRVAADGIAENKAALQWLEQYGTQLRRTNPDGFSVLVRPDFAGACNGHKEAVKILSACAALDIEDIVARAIENCRNTIEILTNAIREEVSPTPPHGEEG